MFELHDQLKADCLEVGDLPLCKLLLLNDSNYPWLILVPRKEGVREIIELNDEEQLLLLGESNAVSKMLTECFSAEKLNIAALGNMVPQLHIHHIARYQNDASWPKPVWGAVQSKPYNNNQLEERLQVCREYLLPYDIR